MKKYIFKPQGNYVAAKVIVPDGVTPGGIILPDQAKDRPDQAEIISVGEGIQSAFSDKTFSIPLKPGDRVFVSRTAYQTVKFPDGEEFIVFQYGDIYGTYEEVEVVAN